jgi:hypothetical protein
MYTLRAQVILCFIQVKHSKYKTFGKEVLCWKSTLWEKRNFLRRVSEKFLRRVSEKAFMLVSEKTFSVLSLNISVILLKTYYKLVKC